MRAKLWELTAVFCAGMIIGALIWAAAHDNHSERLAKFELEQIELSKRQSEEAMRTTCAAIQDPRLRPNVCRGIQ